MSYSFAAYDKEKMARVLGVSLPVSTKQAVEISNKIRGKSLSYAKDLLTDVASGKKAIKFTQFNRDMGHKAGIGPGRYPMKASSEILKILNSVETNAQFKGLNTSSLKIVAIVPNKDSVSWHYGRQRRRAMKRTTIEVVVEESKNKKVKAAPKKEAVKPDVEKKAAAPKKIEAAPVKETPKTNVEETPKNETSVPEKKEETNKPETPLKVAENKEAEAKK